MRRLPFLITTAVAALVAIASFVLLQPRNTPPTQPPRPATPPLLDLREIAGNLRQADPAAAERALAIERALRNGTLAPHDLDGTILRAFIMPAYWLKRDGLLELDVAILGRPDRSYDVELLHADEFQGTLAADIRKVRELEEGISHHWVTGYIDARGQPIDPSSLGDRHDITTLDEASVHRRFDTLKRSKLDLKVRVAGNVLSVTLEPPPDLGSPPPTTVPATSPGP